MNSELSIQQAIIEAAKQAVENDPVSFSIWVTMVSDIDSVEVHLHKTCAYRVEKEPPFKWLSKRLTTSPILRRLFNVSCDPVVAAIVLVPVAEMIIQLPSAKDIKEAAKLAVQNTQKPYIYTFSCVDDKDIEISVYFMRKQSTRNQKSEKKDASAALLQLPI